MNTSSGYPTDAARDIERRELANALRVLAMDAVQTANSGHPGAPMGMADICEVLWRDYLHHNPANPHWPNRDRFVLSNGHGSMLLYALLHLSGYDLSLQDLKGFRQLGSKTPGHPEYGHTPGVETTTGPLGQGLANAVGMAIAEQVLAAHFNRPGFEIVDHHTYVCLGDGCLMEGISHEACSLAGTLGLHKLIAIYDDNHISIDGDVSAWFTDDTPARFRAYGWQVIEAVDGHDAQAVGAALANARNGADKPTLICCRTVIGYGAPTKQGTAACHGAALGEQEVAAARERLGWAHAPFEIPAAVVRAWNARARGAALERDWQELFDAYDTVHPELASEFARRIEGALPANWSTEAAAAAHALTTETKALATRKASQLSLDAVGQILPELFGGSADLTESNLTFWYGSKAISAAEPSGNYLYYGVREFAMGAIMNGLALHGGFIPYGGTFLVFSDYARNAVRMAALMNLGVIYVFTHDSIGLGEDGPTHQPIEQTASLRLIPNCTVWRPCDSAETAVAWRAAIERRDGPSCLLLSRQALMPQARPTAAMENVQRGGYILLEPNDEVRALVLATGSEVEVARVVVRALNEQRRGVRLVSMPAVDVFAQQDASYRERVLPRNVRARVAIEAGASDPWYRYVGLDGDVIGMDEFGASAPGAALFKHFGFTADAITARILAYLDGISL